MCVSSCGQKTDRRKTDEKQTENGHNFRLIIVTAPSDLHRRIVHNRPNPAEALSLIEVSSSTTGDATLWGFWERAAYQRCLRPKRKRGGNLITEWRNGAVVFSYMPKSATWFVSMYPISALARKQRNMKKRSCLWLGKYSSSLFEWFIFLTYVWYCSRWGKVLWRRDQYLRSR